MVANISFSDNILPDISVVYLLKDKILPSQCRLSKTESKFLKEKLAEDKKAIEINSYSRWNFFRVFETDKLKWQTK